jgi:hypothetical protein
MKRKSRGRLSSSKNIFSERLHLVLCGVLRSWKKQGLAQTLAPQAEKLLELHFNRLPVCAKEEIQA